MPPKHRQILNEYKIQAPTQVVILEAIQILGQRSISWPMKDVLLALQLTTTHKKGH